jgi:hypothetical protein
MTILHDISTTIKTDDSTAVRSHKSHDSQVAAICHHSGQYLTLNEAKHPVWKRFMTRVLREQHDFPGLRNLDRAFAQAIHAEEHQHISWSKIAIQSLALLALIPIILFFLLPTLFRLQEFVPLALWFIFLGVLALFALAFVIIAVAALWRYGRRESIFHKNAAGIPPAIADYPVQGHYQINAVETIKIDLDNVNDDRPRVVSQQGILTVALLSEQEDWEDFATYQQQYTGLNVGQHLYGGTIALENLSNVQFTEDALEFDHRIVLRFASDQLDTHGEPAEITLPPISTAYEILSDALYPPFNGLARFPLEVEPRLVPDDSRTLQLRFYWHGHDSTAACRLEECILNVPDVLGRVTRVSYGRSDHERQQVVWRNRTFQQQELLLSITFEEPILSCHDIIKGTYSFSYEELLSELEISPDRIWTALGTVASKDAITVTKRTAVSGKLTLGLQNLSQEHEYVQAMPPIVCDLPPNEHLVEAVTDILLEEGFDLQRIMRAAPRLDPTGRLDKQLYYWDIVGRKYNEELLDSLDIHVVITGSDKIVHSGVDDTVQLQSHIDLRVRCLHDPRNVDTPKAVDALIGRSDEHSLAAKIQRAMNQIGAQR